MNQKHAVAMPDGSSLFWLDDAIMIPEQSYENTVCVRNASFPITHYVITERNRSLDLRYNGVSTSIISLPLGNRSIDALVDFLNGVLEFSFVASYDEAKNTLVLASENNELTIGSFTTCDVLLGLTPGQASVNGVLESRGVDLRGTAAYYIDSNLRTRNRNPVDRGFGTLLATIPITKAQNGIEIYRGDMTYDIQDRIINHVTIRILDDDMRPVVFNGGFWTVTLEFDIRESRVIKIQRNFRDVFANGPLGPNQDSTANQREDEAGRRPERGGDNPRPTRSEDGGAFQQPIGGRGTSR